jgi:hypothetical protein
MHRLTRRLVALMLFFAALTVLAKLTLASNYAAEETLNRITAAIGAPVKAKKVHLGFSASALTGVQVFEAASAAQDPCWTAVGAIDADVSLWGLLTNDLGGGVVTLRDVAVTLAFDRNGRLVTRLPAPVEAAGPMPLVRLEGGTFTLRRDGIPDEVFHNIRLELKTDGEKQTLSGTIDDPDWGPWKVSGGRETAAGPFTLMLKTAREVHAPMKLLRRTPFVGANVWRAVECDGLTTCELTLRFVPGEPVHYRADLSPHDTAVYVPSISLRAAGASGRVVVDDNYLTLTDVRGTAAGGEVRVDSKMDFRTPGMSVLGFGILVNRVTPRLLPETWQAPHVEGQIEGKADIELTLRDGALPVTRGQGQGTLKWSRFLPPLTLYMESDGHGFRFGLGKN